MIKYESPTRRKSSSNRKKSNMPESYCPKYTFRSIQIINNIIVYLIGDGSVGQVLALFTDGVMNWSAGYLCSMHWMLWSDVINFACQGIDASFSSSPLA